MAQLIHILMIVALFGTFSLNAETVSDSFQVDQNQRKVGIELNGIDAESGKATWKKLYTAPILANGYVTATTDGGAMVQIAKKSGDVLTVSAEIKASGLGDGWVSLGFFSAIDTPIKKGSVWLYISPTGGYQIFANGTAVSLNGGKVPQFSDDDFVKVKITYNSSSNAVTAFLNEVPVISEFAVGDYTPEVEYAGFTFGFGKNAEPSKAQVRAFSLSTEKS